jgi:predicted ester cyclase
MSVRESQAQVIHGYLQALSGKPKTDEVIDRFVKDPTLKTHIQLTELALPSYEIVAEQLVSEGDTVAFRGTFRGTHQGPFAGIPPTGRRVSASLMVFYELESGRIASHSMVFDMAGLIGQLSDGISAQRLIV